MYKVFTACISSLSLRISLILGKHKIWINKWNHQIFLPTQECFWKAHMKKSFFLIENKQEQWWLFSVANSLKYRQWMLFDLALFTLRKQMEHHVHHHSETDNCDCDCDCDCNCVCVVWYLTTIGGLVLLCMGIIILVLEEGQLIIGVLITVAGFCFFVGGLIERNSSRRHISQIKKIAL